MTTELTPILLRRERLLVRTVAVLMTLLFATTGGSLFATVLALNARQDTVDRATRRITTLQDDLAEARNDIAGLRSQNAEANTKLDAVLAQIRQLGATPVVAATRSTTTTTAARRSSAAGPTTTTTSAPTEPPGPGGTSPPTTQPPPSPGPGDPPPPDDQPIVCRLLAVPVICT